LFKFDKYSAGRKKQTYLKEVIYCPLRDWDGFRADKRRKECWGRQKGVKWENNTLKVHRR